MGIPDTGEDVRRDEDITLERIEEGDMLRDMEGVRQQEVEDEGTKKSDKEQSKIREGQKTSKIQEKLTKKSNYVSDISKRLFKLARMIMTP